MKIIFFISLIFIASGAFNDGFTRFYLALRFAFIAALITLKRFKKRSLFCVAITLTILGIYINLGLEKNVSVYPILAGGMVTVNKDGFLKVYDDGSSGYSETDQQDVSCSNCEVVKYIKITKGQTYPVTGISISHLDFSTKIDLDTPIGQFAGKDYFVENNIVLNKSVKNPFFTYLGNLMYFPVVIFMLKSEMTSLISKH